MAYQNINQYNFRKLLLSPVREISDISLASDERDFNEEVIFSPLLIGENDGNRMPIKIDFNSPTIIQPKPFDSDTIVSENYWNPTLTNPNLCASSSTLCDVGLTGIDNGLVKRMSGETIEITTGLYLNDNDKFSRYKYDRRFKMHPITGFTTTENRLWNDNSYSYNITYGAEPYVGYYTRLQGGFYQGFYKLAGYEYDVLPERPNLGWTTEFLLRYRWTGDTQVGLNDRYPQNKGTFFYLGARAENKFYHYPDGSPVTDSGYTRVTEGLSCMKTCECSISGSSGSSCFYVYQMSGEPITNCACTCPCECSTVAEFPELNPLYDGVSNGLSLRLSGDTGNPRICVKTYRITGECLPESACTTELKFMTGTSVVEWCSSKGIFDDCADTPYINQERWVQIDAVFRRNAYFEECDLWDKGGLGDIISEEYIATLYDNSLSLVVPPVTQEQTNPPTTEVVNITDKWIQEKNYRLGTFRIYINGRVFMEIEDFEEIIPRPLNTFKEKQIGVPFNISLGGGTQGLHDNLTFSGGCPENINEIVYQQDPECLTTYDLQNTIYNGLETEIRLEEIFGGNFIGDISSFRMYIEPLDASEIRHNFKLLKDRYQLLDPNCVDCNPIPPQPPIVCDIQILLLPCITQTPTSTPTPTPTPTRIFCNTFYAQKKSTFQRVSLIRWTDCDGIEQSQLLYSPTTTPDEKMNITFCALAGSLSYENTQIFVADLGSCYSSPTQTPTESPTNTPTPTQTQTPTESSTNTPTPTQTQTPTESSTNTPTPTQTQTPTESSTNTPTPTPTETPTPTTTPTPTQTIIPLSLNLIFYNISDANTLVGDSSDVNDWNTFFNLPTNGNLFTSLNISGNTVQLFGGSNIHISDYLFNSDYLYGIDDLSGVIVSTGEYSFLDSFSLITVNLPNLITAEDACFVNCTSLTTVNLPSLTTAGYSCFNYCTSLITIDLPSLTTAGDNCFQDCFSLTTVNLPSLNTAGVNCFSDCILLTTVNLPNLIFADSYCFLDCTSLTTINLPSLTTAENDCFNNCTSLTTIDLPACSNLGGTVGYDNVFDFISGNTITLTIPSSLMTCNSGNPDGDIEYLQLNNFVTIIQI